MAIYIYIYIVCVFDLIIKTFCLYNFKILSSFLINVLVLG